MPAEAQLGPLHPFCFVQGMIMNYNVATGQPCRNHSSYGSGSRQHDPHVVPDAALSALPAAGSYRFELEAL